jgi:hypothetical protein
VSVWGFRASESASDRGAGLLQTDRFATRTARGVRCWGRLCAERPAPKPCPGRNLSTRTRASPRRALRTPPSGFPSPCTKRDERSNVRFAQERRTSALLFLSGRRRPRPQTSLPPFPPDTPRPCSLTCQTVAPRAASSRLKRRSLPGLLRAVFPPPHPPSRSIFDPHLVVRFDHTLVAHPVPRGPSGSPLRLRSLRSFGASLVWALRSAAPQRPSALPHSLGPDLFRCPSSSPPDAGG